MTDPWEDVSDGLNNLPRGVRIVCIVLAMIAGITLALFLRTVSIITDFLYEMFWRKKTMGKKAMIFSDDFREWIRPPENEDLVAYLREAEDKKIQAIGIGLGKKDIYRLTIAFDEEKKLPTRDPKRALRQLVDETATRFFGTLSLQEVGEIVQEVGEAMQSADYEFRKMEEK